MKGTAYLNSVLNDADMIDADEINIRSVNQFYFRSLNMNRHNDYQYNDKNFIFRNRDGMTRTAMNLMIIP